MITRDEWLAEFERLMATQKDGDGKTTREIAADLGWSDVKVKAMLRRCADAGRLRVEWKIYTAINGQQRRSPVYSILR